jgi:DNA-binding protein
MSEVLTGTRKTIQQQARSDLQTVIKGFKFAIENMETTVQNNNLRRNSKRQVINAIKEIDILRIVRSPNYILTLIDDLGKLSSEITLQSHFDFLTRLYKASDYRQLDDNKRTFMKDKVKSIAMAYDNSELFRNNFASVIQIYSIALEFDNFDFEKINQNIGSLLMVANIRGRQTARYKVEDNIRSGVKAILTSEEIDFQALYDDTPKVFKPRKSKGLRDIEIEDLLFVRILTNTLDGDFNQSLRIVKEILGEESIKILTKSDLRKFINFRTTKNNEKLIKKMNRFKAEKREEIFELFRLK